MENQKLFTPFASSIQNTINGMSDIKFSPVSDFYSIQGDLLSLGAVVAVGFSGKMKGRLIIDFENTTAIKLAGKISGEEFTNIKDSMVIATLSEIGNVAAGDAVTAINNRFFYSLRVVPPVVFVGEDMVVGLHNMESYTMDFDSEYGKLRINVAFERG